MHAYERRLDQRLKHHGRGILTGAERASLMKRIMTTISLCLLIGILINFAVAIVLLKTLGFGRPGPYRSLTALDDRLIAVWNRFAPDHFPEKPDELGLAGGRWGCQGFTLQVDDITTESQVDSRYMVGVWAGWPFFSLEGYNYAEITYELGHPTPKGSRDDYYAPGIIRISIPWLTRGISTPVIYPFRPSWAGVMLNSVSYGLMVWILGIVFGWLRRTLRLRASRLKQCCPQCRYDVRGRLEEGCPECGWNRESCE